MTPAEYIAMRQKSFPPVEIAYAPRLYSQLSDRFTPKLRQLFESGRIAFGAIGNHEANAVTVTLPNKCYAIEMYEGLPRLLYAISRALCTRVEVRVTGAQPIAPSQTKEKAEDLILRYSTGT